MLNQGVVEQTLIDYLDEKQRVRVEWRKRAESLHIANASDNDAKEFPVIVGVKRLKKDGKQSLNPCIFLSVLEYVGLHRFRRKQYS